MQLTPLLEMVSSGPIGAPQKEIYYPERDGKPMGETDWHITAIVYLLSALRYFFRETADVYVAADMLFYYAEGEPSVCKAPDLFVVRGVTKQPRRIYKLWEEMVAPCVIFEITSKSTRLEDVAEKKGLYEFLGVREYFLFDPLAEYLQPRLQGFQLIHDHYEPLRPERNGSLVSAELGVILQAEGALLRVIDPATGRIIPSFEEATAQAEAARQQAQIELERAQAEAERANTAEAELARLRAELAALKQQTGRSA